MSISASVTGRSPSSSRASCPRGLRPFDAGPGIVYAGQMTSIDPSEPHRAPPVPPVAPEPDDCCRSGCAPCVFDLYEDALARYEAALAAWEAAQEARN